MEFGFTIKPEHSIERTLALTRQAEAAGFAYGWLFDSHVLWREPYVLGRPFRPRDRARRFRAPGPGKAADEHGRAR